MKLSQALILLGLTNFSVVCSCQADPMSSTGEFLSTAVRSGMAEERLAKLAKSHSANEGIKYYANVVKFDHENRERSLRLLAFKKAIRLPSDINADQQAQIDRLYQLSGNDFDRFFVAQMINDNTAMLSYLKAERANRDPDIYHWVEKQIPHAQHLLRMAQDLSNKVATLSSPW